MPIYLTKTVQFSTKVEAFERRGLGGHVATKVSEAAIIPTTSTPLANLIRYNNMSDELFARLEKTRSVYSNKSRAVLRRFRADQPFGNPTLFVEMKSGGEALHAYGMYEAGTSKIGCLAGQPSVEHFRAITAMGIDFYQTVPAGNVNIAGYLAFVQAWRGVHAFFAVGGGRTIAADKLGVAISEAGGKSVAGSPGIEAVVAEDGSLVREAVRGRRAGGIIPEEEMTFVTGDQVVADGLRLMAPTSAAIPGILFPYFREMLEPDMEFCYTTFMNLFAFCLEDTAEKTAEAIAVHRRGFRYLAISPAGRILQHVYFGIDLSIKTGRGLHLIQDGAEYLGFVLKGKDFAVVHRNRIVRSLEAADLGIELSALNSHSEAVRKVYAMLIEIPRVDAKDEEVTEEGMRTNPRLIRDMVQARAVEDISTIKQELNSCLGDMRYSQTYWEITPENILRFLDALRQNAPDRDLPMYPHGDVVANRSSTVLKYLSVFGGQAPSIYHGNTNKAIARPGNQDPNLEVIGTRRAVPHVPFIKKGLLQAAADWATTRRTKSFRYTPARKDAQGKGFSSGKHRDGVVSDPLFDAFYNALREWCYTNEPQVVEPKRAKKRVSNGEEDEDEEMAPVPKKAKFTFV